MVESGRRETETCQTAERSAGKLIYLKLYPKRRLSLPSESSVQTIRR